VMVWFLSTDLVARKLAPLTSKDTTRCDKHTLSILVV
jgi:hypothetical protein